MIKMSGKLRTGKVVSFGAEALDSRHLTCHDHHGSTFQPKRCELKDDLGGLTHGFVKKMTWNRHGIYLGTGAKTKPEI